MKKIMIAAMSLSLLTGTVVFAQNSTATDSSTMKKKTMKHKHSKKSTATDTMSAPK